MPDVAIPSAGSSPAEQPSAAAQSVETPARKVPRDPAAYAEWRKTGKLPEAPSGAANQAKPKEGEAAPSNENSGTPAGDDNAGDGGEAATASEAGKPNRQERGRVEQNVAKPRGNAETRLNEILADLKRAGLTPAELKSFKRSLRDGQPETPVGAAQPPAAASPAAQEPAAPKKLEAPKKPKVEDFDSYDKYEEARDAWQAEHTRYEIAQALEAERQRFAEAETTRRNNAMLAAAAERYGAESGDVIRNAAKVLVGDAAMPGVIKAMFNDSPVLGDLLFVMGSKSDELTAFLELAKTAPGEAVRKLAIVEHLVKEELAKAGKPATNGTPARDGDGKFVSGEAANTAPPAKKVTSAPAPPSETGGRSAAPPDELEQAATAHDFRAYRRAANQRDLAARTGR